MQETLLALLGLPMRVCDLDALEHADRGARGERRTGIVRMQVDLERALVPDNDERVAERLELRLERVKVEPVAFDDENCAVAEFRELLVDRAVRELLGLGRLRERLAGDGSRQAAHELEQSRAARVDDTCVAQNVEV